MRPRHKAAENVQRVEHLRDLWFASMRPRHKAAENDPRVGAPTAGQPRFNEAAA